jgi:EAL domain-containing protein (putative c-di-GMP-specific phosphodiesterase class I)/FixJ family two-component response regulator
LEREQYDFGLVTGGPMDITQIEPKDKPGGARLAYVLDDEPQIAALACNILNVVGFAARQFVDPVGLFAEIRKNSPHLIILDLSLGQSDAIEVIRHLEAMAYKGHVLLMSGRDMSTLSEVEQIGQTRGLAMLPSLQKPFRTPDLKERLRHLAETTPAAQRDRAGAQRAAQPATHGRKPAIGLAEALQEGWLELWYQPKIDLKTFSVAGAEALLRGRHPEFGILSPADLLPPAGDPLYQPLSRFVLRRAMADWERFAESDLPLKLSVNIPVSVINAPDFIAAVRELLPRNAKFPGLIIEVTEDEVILDPTQVKEIATQLKLYNTWISIDDFGAAFSSLARLIDLPCVELKMDRSFVADCAIDDGKRSLCQSAIDLAHRFKATVCAEGVEKVEDLRLLVEMGCDLAQGYLFARPMHPDNLIKLLLLRPQLGGFAAHQLEAQPAALAS